MQNKIPDLAATVAGDASKLAGGAVGIGIEGLVTVTQVAKEAAQIPGDVAENVLGHLEAALRALNTFLQTGEAPKAKS